MQPLPFESFNSIQFKLGCVIMAIKGLQKNKKKTFFCQIGKKEWFERVFLTVVRFSFLRLQIAYMAPIEPIHPFPLSFPLFPSSGFSAGLLLSLLVVAHFSRLRPAEGGRLRAAGSDRAAGWLPRRERSPLSPFDIFKDEPRLRVLIAIMY